MSILLAYFSILLRYVTQCLCFCNLRVTGVLMLCWLPPFGHSYCLCSHTCLYSKCNSIVNPNVMHVTIKGFLLSSSLTYLLTYLFTYASSYPLSVCFSDSRSWKLSLCMFSESNLWTSEKNFKLNQLFFKIIRTGCIHSRVTKLFPIIARFVYLCPK